MSSILWRYKCIARILKRHKAQRVVVHLGCFGASTMKPVPRIATTERFSLDVGLGWMISVAENAENQSFFFGGELIQITCYSAICIYTKVVLWGTAPWLKKLARNVTAGIRPADWGTYLPMIFLQCVVGQATCKSGTQISEARNSSSLPLPKNGC